MIRGKKGVDWAAYLDESDLALLREPVRADAWYAMAAFEHFGIAILHEVAQGQLDAVRFWGRYQTDALLVLHPDMLAPGDPRDSLMRFSVLRRSFFDFDALMLRTVADDHALVEVSYQMSAVAEEAACHQTLGFLEQLVTVAGGREVKAEFTERSWRGDPRTTIELHWKMV